MLDRIPTPGQEGRVLVTPEDGGTPFYARIQMADNPTQDGDPFAKLTMLHDAVAAAYDKDDKAVPNDIFAVLSRFHKGLGNEYVWAKTAHNEVLTAVASNTRFLSSSSSVDAYYADSVSFDGDGNAVLANPVTITTTNLRNELAAASGILLGKYFYSPNEEAADEFEIVRTNVVKFSEDADFYKDSYGHWNVRANGMSIVSSELGSKSYVNSPDPNAYPIDDGYTYTALGQLGNKVQIAAGSYIGTGTSGASNPNSLTFGFEPKVLFVYGSDSGVINLYSMMIWIRGVSVMTMAPSGSDYNKTITASGNTIRWYGTDADGQLNKSGVTYYYVAIG